MQERQRADLITRSSPDAVIACDDDRHITLFNPAAEVMFGVKAASMIGTSIDALLGEQHREPHTVMFTQAAEKLRAQHEDWMVRRDDIIGEGRNLDTDERFQVVLSVRGIKYRGAVEFIANIKRLDRPTPSDSLPLPATMQAVWIEQKPMKVMQ
jgi:PAS domain S-box-containing protein